LQGLWMRLIAAAAKPARRQDSRLPLALQRAATDGRCKRPAQALRIDRDH